LMVVALLMYFPPDRHPERWVATLLGGAATGPVARRLPPPPRLPLAVAWTGTAAAVAMAVAALALVAAAVLASDWPLMLLSGAFAAASHAVVAASSRACRECARLLPSG
ncbi:hypothetical protein ACWEUT_39445, partial [Actinomadura geliboluensis]